MSNYQMLFITAIIIVGVITSIAIVIPYLKKKGVDTTKILNEVKEGLEEAQDVIKAAKELAPGKALDVLQLIDNLALRAVSAAQQLAISGQLPLDQRKAAAKASILAGLKAFNIPITPELEKVINDAIERFVLDSKTDSEKKAQEQNTVQAQIADLQKQKTDAEAKLSDMVTQNALLTQKLNAIQTTVTQ